MIRRAMSRPDGSLATALASLQGRWGTAAIRLGNGSSVGSSPPIHGALALVPEQVPEAPAPLADDAVSTGFPALDAILGPAGLPRESGAAIRGDLSSGKTTLALRCIAEAQREGRSSRGWTSRARSIRWRRWPVAWTCAGCRGSPGRRCGGLRAGGRAALGASGRPAGRRPAAPGCRFGRTMPLRRLAAHARRVGARLLVLEPRSLAALAPGRPGGGDRPAPGAGAAGLAPPGRDVVGQRTEVTVAKNRYGPPGRRVGAGDPLPRGRRARGCGASTRRRMASPSPSAKRRRGHARAADLTVTTGHATALPRLAAPAAPPGAGRDHPATAELVVLGGQPWEPGTVLDCSPAAAQLGVRRGQPLGTAHKLVPEAPSCRPTRPPTRRAFEEALRRAGRAGTRRRGGDRPDASGLRAGVRWASRAWPAVGRRADAGRTGDRAQAASAAAGAATGGHRQHPLRGQVAARRPRPSAERRRCGGDPGGRRDRGGALLAPLPIRLLPAAPETRERFRALRPDAGSGSSRRSTARRSWPASASTVASCTTSRGAWTGGRSGRAGRWSGCAPRWSSIRRSTSSSRSGSCSATCAARCASSSRLGARARRGRIWCWSWSVAPPVRLRAGAARAGRRSRTCWSGCWWPGSRRTRPRRRWSGLGLELDGTAPAAGQQLGLFTPQLARAARLDWQLAGLAIRFGPDRLLQARFVDPEATLAEERFEWRAAALGDARGHADDPAARPAPRDRGRDRRARPPDAAALAGRPRAGRGVQPLARRGGLVAPSAACATTTRSSATRLLALVYRDAVDGTWHLERLYRLSAPSPGHDSTPGETGVECKDRSDHPERRSRADRHAPKMHEHARGRPVHSLGRRSGRHCDALSRLIRTTCRTGSRTRIGSCRWSGRPMPLALPPAWRAIARAARSRDCCSTRAIRCCSSSISRCARSSAFCASRSAR